MTEHEIIIIGGGISGLSLAHYCSKRGLRPLVIEKENRIGGTFYTYSKDSFWFELGAHTCYNSYGNLVDLLNETGLLGRIVKPGKAGYRLFSNGAIETLTSQLNFPELLVSLPRFFSAKPEGETVESYYSKVVGKRNFERVVGPLFSAVICQRANDFPADMLFKKRVRRREVIKKFTLPGGIQTITDAIAAEPGIVTVRGKEVKEISYSSGVFTVLAVDGSNFESRKLALATPSGTAAAVLSKSFPNLSKILAAIGAEKVETLGVIVRKDAVKLPAIAALAASQGNFYSFVSRDTFPDAVFRGFAFHFRAGAVSYEAKLDSIRSVLGTGDFEHIVTAEHVIPSLRLGHKEVIREIDGLIAGIPLLLTGNYFTGLAIEDCLSRSRQEFNRLGP
ncbi:MAG TPA: FAD-dependent oxidoreductase [Thermodesulfovibrionales bacterium]|nr:FAD-dependent oxidoreductase [Thermodesulfovibrionales bacterium]